MNPVKTLCFTISLVALLAASVAAQKVYFYPPDDGKWIAGRSYISQGNAATAVPLKLDEGYCGWYVANIESSSNLREYAQFWLGKPGIDRIGPRGKMIADYDSNVTAFEDFTTGGSEFVLKDVFAAFNNRDVYFVADNLDPTNNANGLSGWSDTRPPNTDDKGRCQWTLAAFIYDTDKSVNASFEEHEKDRNSGTGVQKNMAKQDLDPLTRKIECDRCDASTPAGMFKSKQDFTDAFRDYPRGTAGAKNVKLCYDMPFKQDTRSGSFYFDSDSMTNRSGGLVGGFFPEILDNPTMRNAAVVDGFSNYTDCPTCATKRKAESFAPLYPTTAGNDAVNPWCFNRGYATGTNKTCNLQTCQVATPNADIQACINSCCGAAFAAGAFLDGDNPKVWDWGERDKVQARMALWGASDMGSGKDLQANEHFCFESHAEFFYDPDQEFLFRGDDDIWVYINNKLVIDLGGTHLAAPGSVRLKDITPPLQEGKLYPIDIFFCDRRTTMSNVLINTNMYVVQKSSFFSDPDKFTNTLCASISGGADCASKAAGGTGKVGTDMCGNDLTSNGYYIDFYMINRVSKDTVYLTPGINPVKQQQGCNGTRDVFKCRDDNGITVNNAVYTCGGKSKCRGDADATALVNNTAGISGSFNVYARLMDGVTKKPVDNAKDLLIDSFRGESNNRVIWGRVAGQNGTVIGDGTLKNTYDQLAAQEQQAVAGRRVPVYISTGAWADDRYESFEFYDEADVAGTQYSITIEGGSGLTIYKDKVGGDPIGTTGYTGKLPISGIDTVWVVGSYTIGDKEFTIRTEPGTPAMKLTIRQPELQFRESNFTSSINHSGLLDEWVTKSADGKIRPPVISFQLGVYIVAWDPVLRDICTHCDFPITQESEAVGSCKANIIDPIVTGDNVKMENGKISAFMRGQDDTGGEECTATWRIFGPSKGVTTAEWTKLRFRESPVPVPQENYIYDINGDGIGDRVEIKFNKSLLSKVDSLLPILVEVSWDGTPHYFFYDDPQLGGGSVAVEDKVKKLKDINYVKSRFNNQFFRDNRDYWENERKYLMKDSVTMIIPESENRRFSKDIQTSPRGITESYVSSWIPYIDTECPTGDCNAENSLQYTASTYSLRDRIKPIVLKADFVFNESSKQQCIGAANGCKQTLTVYLSEPVFAGRDAGDADMAGNPFSYCFVSQQVESCPTEKLDTASRFSQTYDNYKGAPGGWDWEDPRSDYADKTTYKTNRSLVDTSEHKKGDSIVILEFRARKVGDGESRMPASGDWVKMRFDSKVFIDIAGNEVNQRERGVLIGGVNPQDKVPIRIGQVKPGDPPLQGIFEPGSNFCNQNFCLTWLGPAARDTTQYLYKDGKGGHIVSEFLPVPKNITDSKLIKEYFPGSVGTLFVVGDKINDKVRELVDGEDSWCKKNGGCYDENGIELNTTNIAKYITLNASAYYHTNLGDYTAHREKIKTGCDAKIFQNEDGGNCYSNGYNFYLAWDLKANSGRTVGAGAYVGISKFWAEMTYYNSSGKNKKTKQLVDKEEFIEMFGVKRMK